MRRSPLFYPMHRGDSDAGGAADLQTDIMRFMAILALCLVAIFALVQSIPLIPEAPTQSSVAAAPPPPRKTQPAKAEPSQPAEPKPEQAVQLTRPKGNAHVVTERRQQTTSPQEHKKSPQRDEGRTLAEVATPPINPSARPAPAANPANRGFTLRFESDLALTRLVASGKVGLYAIDGARARRMAVSESRISFWDASTPAAFHEMESTTVPRPVVDALARSGVNTANIDWGVTLPGKLRAQLDSLIQGNDGGALVIGRDGRLRLEAS